MLLHAIQEMNATILEPTALPSGSEDQHTSTLFSFRLSLMPFEKQLLECILQQAQTESQLRENLAATRENKGLKDEFLSQYVIPSWEPAIKVQKELKTMRMEYSSLNSMEDDSLQPESSGPQVRQRLCDAFFGSLHAPSNQNTCRAQNAQVDNPDFMLKVLNEPDLLAFLKSIEVCMIDHDLGSWEIVTAMWRTHEKEMTEWLFNTPRSLTVFDYVESGFEIRNIVRMYYLHVVRPGVGPDLIRLFESHDDMASKMWNHHVEEQKYRVKKRRKFINNSVITAYLKKNRPDEDPTRYLIKETEDQELVVH